MNKKGYAILVEAIKQYEADPTQQITKELYPGVAKAVGSSPNSVERALRTSINHAWSSRNTILWQLYFPSRNQEEKSPTNGQLIAKMAQCLKMLKTSQEKRLATRTKS